MSEQTKKDKVQSRVAAGLSQFEPGGPKGPIDDPNEYEKLIRSVQDPEQREFLDEASRFATTWQYLSSLDMQLPTGIATNIAGLKDSSLSVRDRITRMRNINQQLMEFIDRHDRKSSSVRQ